MQQTQPVQKRKVACAILKDSDDNNDAYPFYEFDEPQEQSETTDYDETASVSAALITTEETHRICKVILACSYKNKTICLVLDTGATAGLISEKQAKI